MSIFVRSLGDNRAYEAACVRFTFGIAVIASCCACRWIRFRPVNWRLLILRGLSGGGAVLCYFLAIDNVGLAEGSVLCFAFPVFTAIFAWMFLGERQTLGIWAAVATAFAGLYLVLWPKDWSGLLILKLVALVGAVLAGVAVASIRQLRRTDSSYSIFLSQCVFGLAIVLVMLATPYVPAEAKTFHFSVRGWGFLFAIGLFATLGQLVMTFAFKFVPATQGSIFSFVTPVLNVVLGACLFRERIAPHSWVGSCMVIGACVYVSLAKHPPPAPSIVTEG